MAAVFEFTVGFYVSTRPDLSFFEKKTTSRVRSLGRFLKEIGDFEDETLVRQTGVDRLGDSPKVHLGALTGAALREFLLDSSERLDASAPLHGVGEFPTDFRAQLATAVTSEA